MTITGISAHLAQGSVVGGWLITLYWAKNVSQMLHEFTLLSANML